MGKLRPTEEELVQGHTRHLRQVPDSLQDSVHLPGALGDNLLPSVVGQERARRESWTRNSNQSPGSSYPVQDLMSSRQVTSASRSQLASPGGAYLSRLLVGPSHQETQLKGARTGKMALEVPDSSGSLHTQSLED